MHDSQNKSLLFYNVILPRLDHTGPSNLAVDIANCVVESGIPTKIYYLAGLPSRSDIDDRVSVHKFSFFHDLFNIEGVIHSHGLRPDLLNYFFTFRSSCKTMSTLHGHFPHHIYFDYSKWKVCIAWFFWRHVIQRLDLVVCISKSMQRFYKKKNPKFNTVLAYNFRVVSSGKNLDFNSYLGWISNMKRNNYKILIYVGSLIDRKNILNTLKFFKSDENIALIICGKGILEDEIRKFIHCNSLSNKILLTGHIDNPKNLISHCDLLLLPSMAEGLPLVLIEAASLGIPSIMSNIAIHRELSALGFGAIFNFRGDSSLGDIVSEALSKFNAQDVKLIYNRYFQSEVAFPAYHKLINNQLLILRECK